MPVESLSDYVKHLSQLWMKHVPQVPQGGLSITDYLKELGRLAANLPSDQLSVDEGLKLFRSLVIARENDLRWRMLGANVQRRARLKAHQRNALHALEVEPDLLGPMRESRYEPIHTKLLKYHLDPNGGSEIAPDLLTAFVAELKAPCQNLGLPEPTFTPGAEVRVEAERVTSEGRVDLSITLKETLILVENKVDATEGRSQLARYHKALGQLCGTRQGLIVYLTLPGAKPPKSSIPFVSLTFDDILRAWLPFATRNGGASDYLARYLKSIATALLRLCGPGDFERWNFRQQRSILQLVEEY